MWEVVVIWWDKTKDVYEYDTRDKAEKYAEDFKKIFGNQVEWCGVREKLF